MHPATIRITFTGGIDNNGRPQMTTPALPEPQGTTWRTRTASPWMTATSGNRFSNSAAKPALASMAEMCNGCIPRRSKAAVNTPVPGPRSTTGPLASVSSCVMAFASPSLDGATAPTRSGARSHSRANKPRDDAAHDRIIWQGRVSFISPDPRPGPESAGGDGLSRRGLHWRWRRGLRPWRFLRHPAAGGCSESDRR